MRSCFDDLNWLVVFMDPLFAGSAPILRVALRGSSLATLERPGLRSSSVFLRAPFLVLCFSSFTLLIFLLSSPNTRLLVTCTRMTSRLLVMHPPPSQQLSLVRSIYALSF